MILIYFDSAIPPQAPLFPHRSKIVYHMQHSVIFGKETGNYNCTEQRVFL